MMIMMIRTVKVIEVFFFLFSVLSSQVFSLLLWFFPILEQPFPLLVFL